MINKYRVYCTTDKQYETVLASSNPTECPIDSAHSIYTASTLLLESDVQVNDGTLKSLSLAEHRRLRFNEIDSRSEELISAGFTYGTKQFSLSASAQRTLVNAHESKDHVSFTYPISWNTKDDDDTHVVADATDMDNFYITAVGTVKFVLESGTVKKDLVRAAGTKTLIDAVVDDR